MRQVDACVLNAPGGAEKPSRPWSRPTTSTLILRPGAGQHPTTVPPAPEAPLTRPIRVSQEAVAQLGYRPSGAYKIFERCLAALTRGLAATGFVKESACEES